MHVEENTQCHGEESQKLLRSGPERQGGVCFAWPDLSIIRPLWITLSSAMTMRPFTATEVADRLAIRDRATQYKPPSENRYHL